MAASWTGRTEKERDCSSAHCHVTCIFGLSGATDCRQSGAFIMNKKNIEDVTHLIMNSGISIKHKDSSVISDNKKPLMKKIAEEAWQSGRVPFPLPRETGRGMELICNVSEKEWYMATLYLKLVPLWVPLIETAGAFNTEGGMAVWELMYDQYRAAWEVFSMAEEKLWGSCSLTAEPPKVPFICDIIHPGILILPGITPLTGDLTKCFGITMLQMLLDNDL